MARQPLRIKTSSLLLIQDCQLHKNEAIASDQDICIGLNLGEGATTNLQIARSKTSPWINSRCLPLGYLIKP